MYTVGMTIIALCAVALIAALVSGCSVEWREVEKTPNTNSSWESVGDDVWVKVVTIKGHDYVILRGYKQGGIVHAASCSCHKNRID